MRVPAILALKAKWLLGFSEETPTPFPWKLCERLTTEGGRPCKQDM